MLHNLHFKNQNFDVFVLLGQFGAFGYFFHENSKISENTYAADYVKKLALMSINVDSGKFREKMPAEKYVLSTYETWGRKKIQNYMTVKHGTSLG